MRLGYRCLPESRGHTRPSLQPVQLYSSIPIMLSIRLAVYGEEQDCVSLKTKSGRLEFRQRRESSGKSSGPHCCSLQRAARSSPSAGVILNDRDAVSATAADMDWTV